MEYLSLGKIIDSFGLDGTVKVFSTTDNAKLRYKKGNKVFVYDEETDGRTEYTVVAYRSVGRLDYVKFEEVTSPEEVALILKGREVQVIKDEKDLKEGYYFYSDLRGCEIIDKEGKVYGIVKEVEEFPAQITLRVKQQNGKDFFVPFIKEFIVNVDIKKKQITINYMEGML